MSKPWDIDLVEQLIELADNDNPNRAAMAHLRRGLERPPDYVLARVGWMFRRVPDWALENAILVAGLFAWVKGECPQAKDVDFGEAFGSGLDVDQKQRRERRFVDLLDTDNDELPYKLRQVFSLIAKDAIPLDWILLIKHLGQWNHTDRWVQKVWARGFWSAPVEESAVVETESVDPQ